MVLLTVIGEPKTVYCVSTPDRVAADMLAVSDVDLPRVFRELGCAPTMNAPFDSS